MDLSRRALILAAASASAVVGAAARAAEPGHLVCPLTAEPGVLIPGVSDSLATLLVGAQIYRGLLRWGGDGTLEPDLATGIDVAADGLAYTIQLRPGVIWHDSGGFSSADVAFSLRRFHQALQPGLHLGRITVDTPGPLSVVLTLPAPDSLFLRRLTALSLPIVPQHVHDRAGWALDPKQTTPVGTGPFRMEGWLRLVQFEWYAGPKPNLAGIGYPVLPNPAACSALVDGAEPVLLVGDAMDWAAVPRLRALSAVSVEGDYPPAARSMAGLRFNVAARPLDQVEVRLALACAIDRRAALRDGWAGLGRVASGLLISGSSGRDDAATLPDYNPRLAAEHLRAGGLRPDDSGIRARLTCLHPPGPAWSPMLGAVRRSLAQVGIELSLELVPDAEWKRRMAAGDYELSVFVLDQSGDAATDLAAYSAAFPAASAILGDGTPAERQARFVNAMPSLPMVELALPVVRPSGLELPRGVLGSFEGAILR